MNCVRLYYIIFELIFKLMIYYYQQEVLILNSTGTLVLLI